MMSQTDYRECVCGTAMIEYSDAAWCPSCGRFQTPYQDSVPTDLAIVHKLPKTADGVPVVPDMEIWFRGEKGPQRSQIPNFEFRKFDDCYSTREAAEAAKGK